MKYRMEKITSIGYGAEFIGKGIVVSDGFETVSTDTPTTEYDFGIVLDNQFFKVQVKGSHPRSDGRLKVDIRRSKAKKRQYDGFSFDILLVVNMNERKAAFFDYTALGCPQSITLRTKSPASKNGYKQTPVLFDDYTNIYSVIESIKQRRNDDLGGVS